MADSRYYIEGNKIYLRDVCFNDVNDTYYSWLNDSDVSQFLETFKEYPPRMKAASFSLEKVLEQLQKPGNN